MPELDTPYVGEFSLVLGPATNPEHGSGIIAKRLIQPGEDLTNLLFPYGYGVVVRSGRVVPPDFIKYCVGRPDDMWITPSNFGAMDIGWFANHATTPNVLHGNDLGPNGEPIGFDRFVAAGFIAVGGELTYNYNHLGEPPGVQKPYYAGDCVCPPERQHTIASVPAYATIM